MRFTHVSFICWVFASIHLHAFKNTKEANSIAKLPPLRRTTRFICWVFANRRNSQLKNRKQPRETRFCPTSFICWVFATMLMTLICELKIAGVLPAIENVEKRPLFSTSPFLQCIFHLPEKNAEAVIRKTKRTGNP